MASLLKRNIEDGEIPKYSQQMDSNRKRLIIKSAEDRTTSDQKRSRAKQGIRLTIDIEIDSCSSSRRLNYVCLHKQVDERD